MPFELFYALLHEARTEAEIESLTQCATVWALGHNWTASQVERFRMVKEERREALKR